MKIGSAIGGTARQPRRFAAIAILGLLLTAAGCATSYKEPQAGDRARVRLALAKSVPDAIVVVRAYDDDACNGEREWMRLKNGFYLEAKPKRLDMPLWDFNDNAAQEVYVSTERPLHVMFYNSYVRGTTIYSCSVFASADLRAGQDYELLFDQRGPDRCYVAIAELAKEDGAVIRETIKTIDNASPSMACMVAFKKKRLF